MADLSASGINSPALTVGDLEVLGRLPGASNFTLLARLAAGEELVVYKPRRGEAPLWDFPTGTLCQREVAACLVAGAAGWGFVPPTVLRDGPLGLGAVQLFIRHDPLTTAFDLIETHQADLKRIALFDLIVNNADRKAGHVLMDEGGRVWGVDHGLCFHEEPKLRTVLWDFVGQLVPQDDLDAVNELSRCMRGGLVRDLGKQLTPDEIDALALRIQSIIHDPRFPAPSGGRPYPWPPV